MSIEEDNNSPFGESSFKEDEFTDLPLSQGEEEDEHNDEHTGTTSSSDRINNNKTETPFSSAKTVISSSGDSGIVAPTTTAYNPELYSSTLQHSFKDKNAVNIEITDAGKSHEGQSRGYITYTIRSNDSIVRRRYSEFESLRKALTRLFPTLIIPPIPEKHTISKYAVAPTKAKEDSSIIDHRRRMLGVFLNRCLQIDEVRESSVYQSFLDPNSNWSEVLISPPLSNIPKNILQANPSDPSNSSAAHSYLPIPSTTTIQVQTTADDIKFNNVENRAREYEAVIAGGIEKINKRTVKHIADLSNEFSDAGAGFNAFSLQESGDLASVFEKIGQAYDNSYATTEQLVESLNFHFTEPLGESAQFASVVKDILKFRQLKSLQLDIAARSLKHKTNQFKLLENSEQESKRIERAIEEGETRTGKINFDRKVAAQRQREAEGEVSQPQETEAVTPLEPKKSSSFKIPGISKLTNIIKETIESDPEVSRQQNLVKTKEDINQLKQTFTAAKNDLNDVTESLTSELAKFQEVKKEDQRKIILAYTKCILDWSQKNLEFWEETKTNIQTV